MIRKLPFLIILIPICLYFWWVCRFAVNVPQLDDFHAIYLSTLFIREADSLVEAFNRIISFHNEHRLGYTRVMALLASGVGGGPINVTFLIVWGNLSLLGILAVCYQSFQNTRLPLFYFLPVPFLLFQFQFFENTFFAMSALQNLGVWCFVAWTLWLLTEPGYEFGQPIRKGNSIRFFAALGLALLSTFTSGNGFIVWLIGAVMLGFQKKYQQLLLWLVVGAAVVGRYFQDFVRVSDPNHTDLLGMAESFFGFIGAVLGASSGILLPVLAGVVLTGWMLGVGLVSLWKSSKNESSALLNIRLNQSILFGLACFGVILATAAAIAINRPFLQVVSLSRYKIVSTLTLILFYLLTIQVIQKEAIRKLFTIGILIGSVGFWAMTYRKYTPYIQAGKEQLLKDVHDFRSTGKVNNPAYRFAGYDPSDDWKKITEQGLYQFSE